ncbi:MAG TPA: ABC transporter ATP-binding protein [Hyphomicrobiales bacterium]|nr:ABC transporter ATP-binding protein [Hyphomicrobiales bacterium]
MSAAADAIAPATAPVLDARDLTKRFQGLVSVNAVSFTLAKSEILGLIGPNGAGKTTLINMISGALAPSAGELWFEGRRIDGVPAYQRAHLGIGRTFQVMKPFPRLTVLENVAVGALFGFHGGIRSMKEAREAARQCVEFTGLARRIDQSADALGGPDRKRLELAKALAMRPRLLLLDEVMAGLTPVEVDEVVDVIAKIRDSGVTIIVIEHVIKAIRRLSDRILVLHHGEKIAEGDPATVLGDQRVIEAYLGTRRQ